VPTTLTGCSLGATLTRLRRHNAWFDALPEPEAVRRSPSVIVSGFLRDESGWGAAARGYIRALRGRGVATGLRDFSTLTSNRSEDPGVVDGASLRQADVNLVCTDPGQHFAVLSRAGNDFLDGSYNIGAWLWELPDFPDRWYDRFAYYDEIWTGTSFVASALAPIAPVPVVLIPPVLTPESHGSRERGRAEWHLAQDDFVFLFVFDVHSHLQRKNPAAVIDAFRRAFRPSERVRLILKCVNAGADPSGFAALQASAAGASITIADGYVPAARLHDLMAACDAYVSLHRSEGIGLTIAEAMALGKPVVATDWSGNTDFMDVANSFPVSYELIQLDVNVGPYHAGSFWADPSVEHAAHAMRFIVDHREESAARGARARQALCDRYSDEPIGELIERRLDIIGSRDRLDVFRRSVKALAVGYHNLVRQIHEVVSQVVPRDGVVMVVSKGDEELVKFDGRKGCHFPEAAGGGYAGYHPRDSAAAIEGLEASRAKGRQFLLFPGTALWWLDHYDGFRIYLEARYSKLWDDRSCLLYDVRQSLAETVCPRS
jgi:glycosyltransferase involved in cell wall biosynthesis